MSKAAMKSCIPRFNSQRMVVDYVNEFYGKARSQTIRFAENNYAPARELAAWKSKVRKHWPMVNIQRIDLGAEQIHDGESLPIRVRAYLDGLDASDVMVECLVGTLLDGDKLQVRETFQFNYHSKQDDFHEYHLDLKPSAPGLNHYKIRMYPYHRLLSHPFELGFMLWI
jgi:starch phosphorylase